MRRLSALSVFLLFAGASCQLFPPASGGIWHSADGGITWEKRSTISWQDTTGTLEKTGIVKLVSAPDNATVMYAATQDKGVYKTEDGGRNWFPVTSAGGINAIAVGGSNGQTVFAARDDQVFATDDGGDSWNQVYASPSNGSINSLALDGASTSIYAGLSTGELLRSIDGGAHWERAYKFPLAVIKVLPYPFDTNLLYVLTPQQLYVSEDAGTTWTLLPAPVKESIYLAPSAHVLNDILVHPSDNHLLLVLTTQGIYQSQDAGQTWDALPILTRSNESPILAMAWSMNPADIDYATRYVLYHSSDGGQTWQTLPFPQEWNVRTLLMPNQDSQELFLGAISL